jgi:hypothetical protein
MRRRQPLRTKWRSKLGMEGMTQMFVWTLVNLTQCLNIKVKMPVNRQ